MSLTLHGVGVRRGGRLVLDAVSAVVARGRLTVVVGPNGAGKSTLLEVSAGLLAPDAGTVQLGGEPLARIGRRRLAARRGYLPQRAGVDWPISVEAMVALGLPPGLPRPRAGEAIERALAAFALAPLRHRAATTLSGGELARASLARATVAEPELLIVDEPTAGLDPRHALDAAARLRAIADGGAAVMLAVHDLDLALGIADDAIALKGGRVLASGGAGEVLSSAVLSTLFDVPVEVAGGAIRFSRPGRRP